MALFLSDRSEQIGWEQHPFYESTPIAWAVCLVHRKSLQIAESKCFDVRRRISCQGSTMGASSSRTGSRGRLFNDRATIPLSPMQTIFAPVGGGTKHIRTSTLHSASVLCCNNLGQLGNDRRLKFIWLGSVGSKPKRVLPRLQRGAGQCAVIAGHWSFDIQCA
ncbi:hypothetical protein EJ02DRAFT_461657 [Clathrospora elynae]|uniref:Uncharacterized protein n=1 Tax=Clathrospora elynae TaxID=706981 RepID=A0A6A5T5M9_9PLEO|nr:hypothetical protein EJ02DRAFT_461657 [Clathrospora elynae]